MHEDDKGEEEEEEEYNKEDDSEDLLVTYMRPFATLTAGSSLYIPFTVSMYLHASLSFDLT